MSSRHRIRLLASRDRFTLTLFAMFFSLCLIFLPGCDVVAGNFQTVDPREEFSRMAEDATGGKRIALLDLDHKNDDILWSPVVMDKGTVYVVSSHEPTGKEEVQSDTVVAADVKTHSQLWAFESDGQLDVPHIDSGVAVIGSYPADASGLGQLSRIPGDKPIADGSGENQVEPQVIYGIDARDGEVLWKLLAPDDALLPVSVAGGLIFVGTEDGLMYALDVKNGELAWTFKAGGETGSGVAAGSGRGFFGSDDTHVYSVDLRTGKKVWSYKTGFMVRSMPLLAKGKLYVGDEGGRLHVLDADTGKHLDEFAGRDSVVARPLIANGVVYFASEDILGVSDDTETRSFVFAYDLKSGDRKWRFPAGSTANGLRSYKRKIYFESDLYGSDDSSETTLYALRVADGKVSWKARFKWLVQNDDPAKTYILDDQSYLRAPQ